MQLFKIATAIVAVAFTASEAAEVAASNSLAASITNLLRGKATLWCSGMGGCVECCGSTNEYCCLYGTYCSSGKCVEDF